MPTDIVMPQMGESIFEGTITKWLKKPGDKVQRDEPLFEISTDKVDAEIPAPASGVLQDIKVAEGATVQVNTIVGTISADGESAVQTRRRATRCKEGISSRQNGPGAQSECHIRARSACAAQAPASTKTKTTPALLRWSAKSHAKTTSTSRRCPEPDSAAASPSRTSPPFWRRAQRQPRRMLPLDPGSAAAKSDAAPPAAPSIPGDLVSDEPVRKIIAQRMIESRRTSAHVHCMFEVDLTRIVQLRNKNKSGFEKRHGARLTFMPFFCRARPSSRCSNFPS